MISLPGGHTDLVLGTAPLGGLFSPVSSSAAASTLAAAWEAGVRAFDTAPHYGVGLAEQRLGEFLARRPRSSFFVSTKVGRLLVSSSPPADGAESYFGTPAYSRVWDFSGDGVRRSLFASMERLGLDRIDLALIHDPDDPAHARQALDSGYPALHELRASGAIGAIGIGMNQTSVPAWFVERADLDCVLIAGRYSLLDSSAAVSLLPLCERRGVAVLAGGVFNSGILASPVPGASYDYKPAPPSLLARAGRIREVCARYGLPIGAVALWFTLRHPAVTAAVVGARSPSEVAEDVGYLSLSVPDSLFSELAAEGLLPDGAL